MRGHRQEISCLALTNDAQVHLKKKIKSLRFYKEAFKPSCKIVICVKLFKFMTFKKEKKVTINGQAKAFYMIILKVFVFQAKKFGNN